MKFNFKLTNIEVADMKVGSVEVETEFSISEMIAIREETEIVLANMPKYIEQLGTAYKKVLEVDEEVEVLEIAKSKLAEALNK